MRILIYGILILATIATMAGPEKVHHEIDLLTQDEKALKKQAELDMDEWEDGLFNELLMHESPNVRIFAIRTLIRPIKDLNHNSIETNQFEIDKLRTFIDNIINDNKVGAQALNMLSAYCFNEQKNYQCDNNQLLGKLIELEPKNIASYVSLLDKAVEAQDSGETSEVLSSMANATYHNHYFSVHPELEQAVIEFADDNPLPESLLQDSLKWLGNKDLSQQFFRQELEGVTLYSLLIGIKMAIPMPSYRILIDTCKEPDSYKESCLKISDTLINNSYTIIAKSLGYAIQEEIYKNHGDYNQYQTAKQVHGRFSNSYTCLSKSLYSKDYTGLLFTKEKLQKSIQVERDHGELASFKKLAELNYQQHLINGDLDALNPDTCFK